MRSGTGPALGHPPVDRRLPEGFRVAWDPRTLVRAGGEVLLGGSPWRISRLSPPARAFAASLRRAGPAGVRVVTPGDAAVARVLLDRGFAYPVPETSTSGGDPDPAAVPDVTTVVPVLDRVDGLLALLQSGIGTRVIVVDDGSRESEPVAEAAAGFGATVVRHEVNRGPAAARNTGARAVDSSLVAFVDSDCVVESDWPGTLAGHFADPGVAAVAPRVAPLTGGGGVLERFEQARSALDMGRWPELVRHGARLGFVPSAALVVRRRALGDQGFDEDLRLGEDVDLVWRLDDAGWQVRYDPSVVVRHRTRERLGTWARRSFEYGTSAADLEARHAGYLAPARLSAWNLATLALVARGHPVAALAVTAGSAALLARHLRGVSGGSAIAGETVARGVLADAAQLGRLLRREWWPVGALALAAAPRSRVARVAVACMMVPVALDYGRERPRLDPLRYVGLQWIDDAAYGSGVIASSVRSRSWAPLLPRVRMPRVPRVPSDADGSGFRWPRRWRSP